jgi:branched-chain amino acid transport system permease protein
MSTKTDAPATPQKPPAGAGFAAPVTDWRKIAGWTLLGLAAVIAPFVAGRLWTGILTQGVIIAIGALGLNVLTGYTGLASLGHSFFLGVGALTLRFRGLYLTMVTLGLVFIGVHIFLSLRDLSGGSQGRSFPAPTLGDFKWNDATSTLGPLELTRDQKFYFLVLPLLVLIVLFTSNMMKTRIGRAFQAVRDRQVAAELMGINAANTKIIAFVFSSVLAGICGALFASHLRRVQPDFWSLELAILFIAMVIIGGIATVGGSILGALLLMALPQIVETFAEFLPFVQQGVSGGGITKGDLTEIIYALFLALFLVFEPTGLVGIYRRVTGRFTKR